MLIIWNKLFEISLQNNYEHFLGHGIKLQPEFIWLLYAYCLYFLR